VKVVSKGAPPDMRAVVLFTACVAALAKQLRGHSEGARAWDFEQPGFKPHTFQGIPLDSGLCSLPVVDVFDGLLADEAAEHAAVLREAVPTADRPRWRAFLAHGAAVAAEPADPENRAAWHARRRALLRSIVRRKRPVVVRGLLDAARVQRAWTADALCKKSTANNSAPGDHVRGDAPLAGAGAPAFQVTYDAVAAGGQARDDGHGYSQNVVGFPPTLREFVAAMHADRDAELHGPHAAHPMPRYAFLGSLPPQLEAHLPLRAFADELATVLAATTADDEGGGVGRRQFLAGPAFASTLPHRHGPALQVLLTGAKRWFTDARDGEHAEPLDARNHSLCWAMGRCSALEVLAGRFEEWDMGMGADAGGAGGADDCVLRAAEALFVPDGVCHAAVNCVDSIAFTYEFASERLAPLPPLPPPPPPPLGWQQEL